MIRTGAIHSPPELARDYGQRIQRHIVMPVLTGIRENLEGISETTPATQLRSRLNVFFAGYLTKDHPLREELLYTSRLLARGHVFAVDAWHRARTQTTFRAALDLDVSPLLHEYDRTGDAIEYHAQSMVHLPVRIHAFLDRRIKAAAGEERAQRLAWFRKAADDPIDVVEIALQQTEKSALRNGELAGERLTSNLNGDITEDRQRTLGLKKYEWEDSADRRVRRTHRENNGHTFEWKKPPRTGHPGHATGCRCGANPVLTGEEADHISYLVETDDSLPAFGEQRYLKDELGLSDQQVDDLLQDGWKKLFEVQDLDSLTRSQRSIRKNFATWEEAHEAINVKTHSPFGILKGFVSKTDALDLQKKNIFGTQADEIFGKPDELVYKGQKGSSEYDDYSSKEMFDGMTVREPTNAFWDDAERARRQAATSRTNARSQIYGDDFDGFDGTSIDPPNITFSDDVGANMRAFYTEQTELALKMYQQAFGWHPRDLKFRFYKKTQAEFSGEFSLTSRTITMHGTHRGTLSTLVHEIGHAVEYDMALASASRDMQKYLIVKGRAYRNKFDAGNSVDYIVKRNNEEATEVISMMLPKYLMSPHVVAKEAPAAFRFIRSFIQEPLRRGSRPRPLKLKSVQTPLPPKPPSLIKAPKEWKKTLEDGVPIFHHDMGIKVRWNKYTNKWTFIDEGKNRHVFDVIDDAFEEAKKHVSLKETGWTTSKKSLDITWDHKSGAKIVNRKKKWSLWDKDNKFIGEFDTLEEAVSKTTTETIVPTPKPKPKPAPEIDVPPATPGQATYQGERGNRQFDTWSHEMKSGKVVGEPVNEFWDEAEAARLRALESRDEAMKVIFGEDVPPQASSRVSVTSAVKDQRHIEEMKEVIDDTVSLVNRALGGDEFTEGVHFKVQSGGRGFLGKQKVTGDMTSDIKLMNLPSAPRDNKLVTAIHEMGHHLEETLDLHAASRSMQEYLLTKPFDRQFFGALEESGFKDYILLRYNFGKDPTEVISMMLPRFFLSPHAMAKWYPEYFRFMYSHVIAKGRIKGRSLRKLKKSKPTLKPSIRQIEPGPQKSDTYEKLYNKNPKKKKVSDLDFSGDSQALVGPQGSALADLTKLEDDVWQIDVLSARPGDGQKKNTATKLLDGIIDKADDAGTTLKVRLDLPDSDFMPSSQLKDFYLKNGFDEIDGVLIRSPKGTPKSLAPKPKPAPKPPAPKPVSKSAPKPKPKPVPKPEPPAPWPKYNYQPGPQKSDTYEKLYKKNPKKKKIVDLDFSGESQSIVEKGGSAIADLKKVDDKVWEIDLLAVRPGDGQSSGAASNLMRGITKKADTDGIALKVKLDLPDTDFMPVDRLKKFYLDHGFSEIDGVLVRSPKRRYVPPPKPAPKPKPAPEIESDVLKPKREIPPAEGPKKEMGQNILDEVEKAGDGPVNLSHEGSRFDHPNFEKHKLDPEWVDEDIKKNYRLRGYIRNPLGINRALRSGKKLNQSKAAFMRNMKSTASPLKTDRTVYRGMSMEEGADILRKTQVDLPALTSVAMDPEIAMSFVGDAVTGKNRVGVLMQINLKHGTQAIVTNATQTEVIIMPGAKLTVKRVVKKKITVKQKPGGWGGEREIRYIIEADITPPIPKVTAKPVSKPPAPKLPASKPVPKPEPPAPKTDVKFSLSQPGPQKSDTYEKLYNKNPKKKKVSDLDFSGDSQALVGPQGSALADLTKLEDDVWQIDVLSARPGDGQKKNTATKLLDGIIDKADDAGTTLKVRLDLPDSDFMPSSQLKNFYSEHGFEEIDGVLIRSPKGTPKPPAPKPVPETLSDDPFRFEPKTVNQHSDLHAYHADIDLAKRVEGGTPEVPYGSRSGTRTHDLDQHTTDPLYKAENTLSEASQQYIRAPHINRPLRNGDTLSLDQKAQVNQLLADSTPLPTDRIVYRSLKFDSQKQIDSLDYLQEGYEGTEKAFLSTSMSPGFAANFQNARNTVLFQIRAKKGSKAIITNANQAEVLLMPGLKWRVVKRHGEVVSESGHRKILFEIEVAPPSVAKKIDGSR